MAAPVYLLDTNVGHVLGSGTLSGAMLWASIASVFGLLDTIHRPLVSIVTHGELLVMADRNEWGRDKLAALQTALDNLVTIDLNDRGCSEPMWKCNGTRDICRVRRGC